MAFEPIAMPFDYVSLRPDLFHKIEEDKAVYFFVKSDLAEEDQMVQAGHVLLELGMALGHKHPPKYRLIGLDGGSNMPKLLSKLRAKNVPFTFYEDTDHPEWGITAVATPPLSKEESLPLANYRLRRYSPVAQRKSAVLETEVVGSSPTG